MKIVFLGNTNNIVYGVAQSLHEKKYDVTFLVDAEKDILLDRPESYDPELKDNYPLWIKEVTVKEKMRAIKLLYPSIFLKKILRILNQHDVIFLNGWWISLGKYLDKKKLVINVFGGYDLDFANYDHIETYIKSFYSIGYRKIFPRFIVKGFYKQLIKAQSDGIRRADVVNYYTQGVNVVSDAVLEKIKKGQQYKRLQLRGIDCSEFPYSEPDVTRKKFVILNITRFFYLMDRHDNKRNDLMIKGIGEFVRKNNISENLEIIFFEKGENLAEAKKLCEKEGLNSFINWKKEVSVDELTKYFNYCDVAFDQLGVHWIGAGLFSMLTGRPLIANARPDVFEALTGEVSPVCQATSAEEVCLWLTKLYYNRNLVSQLGLQSRAYVLKHYDLKHTVNFYIECFADFFEKAKPANLPLHNKFVNN